MVYTDDDAAVMQLLSWMLQRKKRTREHVVCSRLCVCASFDDVSNDDHTRLGPSYHQCTLCASHSSSIVKHPALSSMASNLAHNASGSLISDLLAFHCDKSEKRVSTHAT